MPSETLLRVTLAEICERQGGVIQTGPFGSQLHASDYTESGTPVVMPADIAGGRISTASIARVGAEHVERLSQHRLRLNDIVFSRRGDVTRFARVTAREVGWLCGTGCLKVRVGTGSLALPEWVSLALDAPESKEWLVRHAVGATMPNLNTSILGALPLEVPPLEQQRNAIGMCFSLDDRIDLLRQTNATLESIAQALFKSWFIDFDPVRAKAEGREPEGMDAATAALFPAEFEESALGLIPKGWRATTAAEAVELNPSRSLSKGSDARYLEMANAPTGGHRPIDGVPLRAFSSGCKFRNGDALLAKITPCLENGKSAFIDFLDDDEVGWGSTEFIVLRAKPVLPRYGAYLLTRHQPFRQFAIQAMTGTSGRQRVDLSRLAQFPLALPPDSAIARAVEPDLCTLQQLIATNDEQAKTLAVLRDTLLPRLISGKLRLPEARAELDEALA